MTIILFLFLILLFLVLFASSVILSLVRWFLSFLGFGNKRTGRYTGQSHSETSDTGYTSSSSSSSSGWHYSPEAEYKRRKRKKIIQQDEGEYVDYEEVKK